MAPKPREIVLQIVPRCEECPASAPASEVLLVMEPGVDNVPWFLCPACWVKGWKDAQPLRPIAIVE